MDKSYADLLNENDLLKKENLRLNGIIEKLQKTVQELTAEVKRFNNELRKYVNENTPSSAVAPFNKDTPHHHNKTPGREKGHEGSGRKLPDNVDETKEAETDKCPDCNGEITDTGCHDRTIEVVVPAKVKVVKIHIHRYWCSNCKKIVDAPVKDAFPNSRFGVETYLLIAFFKFGLGLTYGKIIELLKIAYGLNISKGALPQMLDSLAGEFGEHYDELKKELRKSPYVNGDETSWRKNGKNWWLWTFVGKWITFYAIENSRGKNIPKKVLGKDYEGTVGSDFLGAYNYVGRSWQKCGVHLGRDLKETAKKKRKSSEFFAFKKRLRRILDDSMRLKEREKRILVLREKKMRLEDRITALCEDSWKDHDCRRLVKRLKRHTKNLFTFLVIDGVTPDNNIAERAIRPAVIMRKNSYGSRGDNGITTTPILLTTLQTCKMNDQNFLDWGRGYLGNKLSSSTSKH